MSTLARRDVLKLVAAALMAPVAHARAGKKVIVAGGGIAGLCCGYELMRRGHDVTVLEASGRTGGQVFTFREGLDDGLYADAGAEHFTNPGYDRYRAYVDEFKLRVSHGTAGLRPPFEAQYETFRLSNGVPDKEILGNPQLRPAYSKETEYGVNLAFLQNFNVEYTYSEKRTTDEIIKVPLAHPEQSAVVNRANIFSGLTTTPTHAPGEEDLANAAKAAADQATAALNLARSQFEQLRAAVPTARN